MISRDDALALLFEHTPSDSLRRHCLGVEACVRWYARKLGQDEATWGLAGLLHDFDYERHPDEHPLWGMALLRERGYPEDVVRAIATHYPEKTGVAPESPLERHLFACDELTGLITAVAYVRPSRSVQDVEVKSVMKKFKTPSFAAGVNRADVTHGAELIGLPLEEHVGNCIAALRDAE
jgi:putative nucleotidyltransferase with HDIG domain